MEFLFVVGRSAICGGRRGDTYSPGTRNHTISNESPLSVALIALHL